MRRGSGEGDGHARAPAGAVPVAGGSGLSCTVTRDPDLLRRARALRHDVFVRDRGAAPGPEAGLEGDGFDAGAEHAVVIDPANPEPELVATARVGSGWTARAFDLSVLTARGLRMAEVGRACVHPDHRGGLAGLTLLMGVVDAAQARGVQVLVGAASFPGRDPAPHLPALRALRAAALAPPDWRPVARGPGAVAVAGEAPRAAMAGVPPLVKTYLRAGAWVGEGAHVDAAFNVVDVCIVLDMARLRLPAGLR